jgi:hypothetical protein
LGKRKRVGNPGLVVVKAVLGIPRNEDDTRSWPAFEGLSNPARPVHARHDKGSHEDIDRERIVLEGQKGIFGILRLDHGVTVHPKRARREGARRGRGGFG